MSAFAVKISSRVMGFGADVCISVTKLMIFLDNKKFSNTKCLICLYIPTFLLYLVNIQMFTQCIDGVSIYAAIHNLN